MLPTVRLEGGRQSLDDSTSTEVAPPDTDADDIVTALLEVTSSLLDSREVSVADLIGQVDPAEDTGRSSPAKLLQPRQGQ